MTRLKVGAVVKLLAHKMAEAVEQSVERDRDAHQELVMLRREMRDELRVQGRNLDKILAIQNEQSATLKKITDMIAEDKRPTVRMQAVRIP